MAYLENINIKGEVQDFAPTSAYASEDVLEAKFDPDNNLKTRSQVITDEGTFRVNFANSSLRVSIGTCTFTNSSNIVTGTGFEITDLKVGDYVNIDGHAESTLVQVKSFTSTVITLDAPYTGATTTGVASRQILRTLTGAGATITVATGQATIACGTTASSTTVLGRFVDVAPLVFGEAVSVSQRIANQTINIGLNDEASPIKWFARFSLDGTTNTTVKCQTARNPTVAPTGNEIQETIITIPNGLTTATSLEYRIELLTEGVIFYINDVRVAKHTRVIPSQYDYMGAGTAIINGTTPASNTNVIIDYVTCKNHNKLEIGVMSSNENIQTTQPPLTSFSYNQAGVIPINTDLMVIDCSQLRSISVHVTSLGTTGVISGQWTNDPLLGARQTSLFIDPIGGGITATFTTTALRFANVYARYLVLRMTTATTAGTTTVLVSGFQSAIPNFTNNQGVNLVGTNTLTTVTTVGTVTTLGNGQTAHSSASTGSPVRIGGRVLTTADTSLANGDASDLLISSGQQAIIKPYAVAETDWQYANPTGTPITTTTPVVLTNATASLRKYVTGIQFINTSAVASLITIRDGATVIWTGFAPASMTRMEVVQFVTPLRGSINTAMNVQVETTATNTFVSAQGYQSL